MNGKISKSTTTSSIGAGTITTASSDAIHSRQRIAQNFLLIWVDSSINESKQDCQNTLAQLRSVVNDVNIFTQQDEGVDFLTEVDGMKAFLIVEGTIGQHIVPLIHDIPHLDAIFIFCGSQSRHERWTKEWVKIKGVYTDIKAICEALQLAAKHCNQDSVAVSFVKVDEGTSNANLNQLEPSFMYTQIFKEILLEMEHDEKSVKHLVIYCREFYKDNMRELNIIHEFENNYRSKSPIWWYTRECFSYQMLNRALRTLESDTIINMGFFIRDLHQQIQELHRKHVNTYRNESFTVYRGQGLSTTDFEKLQRTKGGLMSFNNFLSSSENPDVSLRFAKSALTKTNMIGIFFKMSIDPSISSARFASIREVSYFQKEDEILLAMHTVFRVGEITKIDNNSLLYRVNLELTVDDDPQLRTLTERIRKEVVGETGWRRLGALLVKIGHFDKAEELYNVLLEQISNEGERAIYYNNLGCIKQQQGDYKKAIEYLEKGVKIEKKTLSSNQPLTATSYGNIGLVYSNMGEYLKALSFYEKAREILQKTLPRNHILLAISYNNIGEVYQKMGEYSKALSFFETALEILRKTLPSNHPDLATSYGNIGLVYMSMGEYSKALLFDEKAHEILQKTLPLNHPSLATSYNNIGEVYRKMGENSKALSFDEKALEIRQKTLPPNHPDLATTYNNIGLVYMNMREYSKALSFYEKALEIRQKMLPPNNEDFAQAYNNIAGVYYSMGVYSKSLSFYQRGLNILQSSLPSNHPNIELVQRNIEYVKKKL